ncbi:alcohol oxidase [Stereum hirsutum FP-91666 SS1]|uniref:alcohol oxidase n=1 Tax=Stereum hirsutum (strain FP-91666) TaxID=721885 RepID=UPI000440F974|nr:alcohol oxidase [Stereum hirsutum FP-91666 SS1]EIM92930.1 alcohol oxidase [Stereum hirsutum FP-91666 SS1]
MDIHRLAALLLTVATITGATVITNDSSAIATSFEYIIVGGGTTGLAIANRLSVKHTVLVVERGDDEINNEGINNPFIPFGAHSASVTCHLAGSTPPQVGANETRVLPVAFGNCLGGGSSINTMMGSRPTVAGMDAIAALGNPGWEWDNFLPFMERSETFSPPDEGQIADGANFNASVHGFSGPVGVSFANPLIAPEMQFAAKNTSETIYGLTLTTDLGDGFSGGHVSSFYHHIHFNETLQEQRRSSSAWSYLYPQDQQRSGLTVLTQHRVNSILTTPAVDSNISATGTVVEPIASGGILTFNATREVVVSAGALFSPAVLQHSGIGNSTFLQSLGITPVLDLPGVGSNFQDQTLMTNISFPINNASASNTNITGTEALLGIVVAHATADNAFGPNGTAMVASAYRNISAERALESGGVVNFESLSEQASVIADAIEADHPLIELFFTPGSQLSIWAQSVLPISRGTVRINSTDPSDMPVINPEYLSNEVDVDIMIRASRRMGEAAATPPFSDFLTPTAFAQSGMPALNATDEEWRVWMLETYLPGVHFIGSNSMMPQELGGVVSPELLVYGTTNIRVADASIMPLGVFPHCTLGLYGVGEKAAEMILQAASTN